MKPLLLLVLLLCLLSPATAEVRVLKLRALQKEIKNPQGVDADEDDDDTTTEPAVTTAELTELSTSEEPDETTTTTTKSNKKGRKETTTTTTTTTPPKANKGKKGKADPTPEPSSTTPAAKKKKGKDSSSTTTTPPKSSEDETTSTEEALATDSTTDASSGKNYTLRNDKFVDFHDVIDYSVDHDLNRVFSSMLVFQLIRYRHGNAAMDKKFVDRVLSCLTTATPEIKVLANLREKIKSAQSVRELEQSRGLAARTVAAAIRRFYLAADEEGLPGRLINSVIVALQTFAQPGFGDPFAVSDSPETDGPEETQRREEERKRRRDEFEAELERLLDQIERNVMEDYDGGQENSRAGRHGRNQQQH